MQAEGLPGRAADPVQHRLLAEQQLNSVFSQQRETLMSVSCHDLC